MHTPAVERLLAASRGQVEAAYARYMAAHDALVVSNLLAICCRLPDFSGSCMAAHAALVVMDCSL